MSTPIIDKDNPAPWGPVGKPRRSIVNIHKRRRKQEIRRTIRDLRRKAAAERAPLSAPLEIVPEQVDLSTLTRDQLRGVCKERGIQKYGSMNKAGLLAVLGA